MGETVPGEGPPREGLEAKGKGKWRRQSGTCASNGRGTRGRGRSPRSPPATHSSPGEGSGDAAASLPPPAAPPEASVQRP